MKQNSLPIDSYFSKLNFEKELSNFEWISQEPSFRQINVIMENYGVLINFNDFEKNQESTMNLNGNWKTFIEIHLDNYHIAPFHAGLNSFIDIKNLSWNFFKNGCLQKVPIKFQNRETMNFLYDKYFYDFSQKNIIHQTDIFWFTFYPNYIFEYYPGIIFKSKILPITSREFRCDIEIFTLKNLYEAASSGILAYNQTFKEDLEIFYSIERGREALFNRHENENGPYQKELEAGVSDFHRYIISNLQND